MLFDNDRAYTSKEVRERMNINTKTLLKFSKNGLRYIPLPGSNHRRYMGNDLNEFFNKTE